MFFQKEIETMSRGEIESLQLERLKWIVDYCDRNVEFYHKRLQKAGVTADKIKSLKDVRYIPVTTKDDIRDTYPFGLFAQPLKNIVRVHASSGTTGKPTVVGYTKKDLDTWSDLVARLCVAAGATDEDIVQISFGYGLFTGALGLHYGLEKIGATVVPCSSGNTEKQVMLMKDFGTTALVSTPSYALHMSEVAHEHGITNDQLKLRLEMCIRDRYIPGGEVVVVVEADFPQSDDLGVPEHVGDFGKVLLGEVLRLMGMVAHSGVEKGVALGQSGGFLGSFQIAAHVDDVANAVILQSGDDFVPVGVEAFVVVVGVGIEDT